jgi:hypothetical protein
VTTQAEARTGFLDLPGLVALALVGAAVGVGVVRLNGFGPVSFRDSGQFRLWLFLIATQTALWAIAVAAFFSLWTRMTREVVWSRARGAVVAYVVAAAIPLYGFVVYASLRTHTSDPLPDHKWKLFVLYSLGTAIALIGVAEFALLKACLQNEAASGSAADVARYVDLRVLLQRVLTVEGAILAAAVLAAGALRNAVIAYTHHQSGYPREYVFIVGAFFTLILALLYTPVYTRLLEVGRANLDAACPLDEPASPEWLALYGKREKLAQYLQLDVTPSASFQSGIAILAPLASALVPLLLGSG